MSSRHPRWLLCGGIGSGKSEVRRLLTAMGIRAVDADAIGHRVLEEEALVPVAERWPGVVFEGKISREALARVVFSDLEELAALEAITHPLIFGRIRSELEGFSALAVVEVPLLETGLDWPRMVVDATDEARVRNSVSRGMAIADVEKRMAAQPSREQWLAVADVVVPNHGSLGDLEHTVELLAAHLNAGAQR